MLLKQNKMAYTVDESQSKAAKVAGFSYLITFATVVCVNFGIHDRLIVDNRASLSEDSR